VIDALAPVVLAVALAAVCVLLFRKGRKVDRAKAPEAAKDIWQELSDGNDPTR